MTVQNTARRGTAGAFVVIAVSGWAVLAPLLFGGDEAADWGWNPLLLSVAPGVAAAFGGVAMLAGKRFGALVALAGGLWLALGSTTGIVWAGGALGSERALEDAVRLLLWVAFFFQAGALIALFSAHALGLLDGLTAPIEHQPLGRPAGARRPIPCESRRRRGNVSPLAVQRERLQGAARRRTRPDERAR